MRPDEFHQMRLSLKLTQARLGEALGVSQRHVGRWERGEAYIPRVVVLALAFLDIQRRRAGGNPAG